MKGSARLNKGQKVPVRKSKKTRQGEVDATLMQIAQGSAAWQKRFMVKKLTGGTK